MPRGVGLDYFVDDRLEDEMDEEEGMTPRPTRRELREAFTAAHSALRVLRNENCQPYEGFWDAYGAGDRALVRIEEMRERLDERRRRG